MSTCFVCGINKNSVQIRAVTDGTLTGSVQRRDGKDDAAGYFLTGISGGLGSEIVGGEVNDNSFSDDFVDCESTGEKDRVGISGVPEQGRQISCMGGMGAVSGIVVHPGVIKGIGFAAGTGRSAVDMEAEDGILAVVFRIGQSPYFCFGECPEIGAEKPHKPVQIRILRTSADLSPCVGASAEDVGKAVIGVLMHTNLRDDSVQCMQENERM